MANDVETLLDRTIRDDSSTVQVHTGLRITQGSRTGREQQDRRRSRK